MNSFSIPWNANEIFALNPSHATENGFQVESHFNHHAPLYVGGLKKKTLKNVV